MVSVMSREGDRGDPNRRFWDEPAQTMPRAERRALQDERLRRTVHHVYEHAPFFRRRYDEAGVSPDDITTVDDIGRLPMIYKDDLRKSEIEHPPTGDYRCFGLDHAVRLTTSTGTTGKPTIAMWTRNDLLLDYELSARCNWRAGQRPGHVVVNAHPGYLNGGESFIAGDCQYMGMLPISLGPPETVEAAGRALRAIEGIHVDHWRLFPAALHRFHEAKAKDGISVDLPAVEAIGPLGQYEKVSAGQECISVLGGQCGPGTGGHLAEDYAVVEVVDVHTQEAVADGARGLLVVTSLERDNPLVRYNNEDVVRVESAPCSCGETSRRGFYEGRVKDIVWVAGRIVLPIDVWFELPVQCEYQLVRPAKPTDHLTIRVEHDPAPDLAERLRTRIGAPVEVQRVAEGSIPRAAFKPTRVVDEA
jgi:phenylacetate-CoA ligase